MAFSVEEACHNQVTVKALSHQVNLVGICYVTSITNQESYSVVSTYLIELIIALGH